MSGFYPITDVETAIGRLVDEVDQDYIPIKDGDIFINSPLRKEGNTLVSSLSIQAPPASFKIGGNVTLSDTGSSVGYSLTAQGSTFEISGSLYSEAAGTLSGLNITEYPSGAISIPSQPSDALTLQFNDYTWQARIEDTNPQDLFRVYRVAVRGDIGAQAPVRIRLYIEDPALNPGAVPFYDNVSANEPEWLAGNAGFIISPTGESVLDFGEGQRIRVGLSFWIRYTVPDGHFFTIKGDNVVTPVFSGFVPYQESTIMAGYEREVFPLEFRELLSLSAQFTNQDYDLNPVLKMDEDFTILSGDYVITVSFSAGGLTTNRSCTVGVFVDDVLEFDEYEKESKDSSDNHYPSKTFVHTFTEGLHNIKVRFGRRGGDGASFVFLRDVVVVLRRVNR